MMKSGYYVLEVWKQFSNNKDHALQVRNRPLTLQLEYTDMFNKY